MAAMLDLRWKMLYLNYQHSHYLLVSCLVNVLCCNFCSDTTLAEGCADRQQCMGA